MKRTLNFTWHLTASEAEERMYDLQANCEILERLGLDTLCWF